MSTENNTKQTTPSLQVEITIEPYEAPFVPHPELLMAAQWGDWQQLERLLGQIKQESAVAGDVIDIEMSSAIAPAEAVTVARVSLLHVVASRGDGDQFLKSASVIYGKASHLLDARNKKGDTPLHCAARAGWGAMVTHLVALARSENGGSGEKVKVMLRIQNGRGETVLHEAVRLGDRDMIGLLIAEEPQLARVPLADGASPLYLAVELGHDDIARQLYENDQALSYSGPDGRNALHAAVLKSKNTTIMLLKWNKDLIKQADRSTGSTPLHFAASWGKQEEISLLMDADPSAVYQPDIKGSFPIHVAAFTDKVKAVSVLLDGCHDCAELCNANGMNFLHVAVQKKSQSVVKFVCNRLKVAPSVMNMQDDDGNTPLHLAVKAGNLGIFNCLMERREVKLNVTNNKGQTPLDLSRISMPWIISPAGFLYAGDPRIRIWLLLEYAGAQNGTYRWDLFQEELIPRLDPTKEVRTVTTFAQTICIGSVLIATVAFTAAFTIPGGYRADDHENGGTPTLAGHSTFHVFIIADTLALILSSLSITLLMQVGVGSGDVRTRALSYLAAMNLMAGAARSLTASFAFGLYMVLVPVARATAVASFAITALALVDVVWLIRRNLTGELALLKRLGARAWWRTAGIILMNLLCQFWPYIVIAGVVKCIKIKGVH